MNYKVDFEEIENLVNKCKEKLEPLEEAVEEQGYYTNELLEDQKSEEFITNLKEELDILNTDCTKLTNELLPEFFEKVLKISENFKETDERLKK